MSGLKYIHELFILHKNINPENLLIKTDTERPILSIGDFGLSCIEKFSKDTNQPTTINQWKRNIDDIADEDLSDNDILQILINEFRSMLQQRLKKPTGEVDEIQSKSPYVNFGSGTFHTLQRTTKTFDTKYFFAPEIVSFFLLISQQSLINKKFE